MWYSIFFYAFNANNDIWLYFASPEGVIPSVVDFSTLMKIIKDYWSTVLWKTLMRKSNVPLKCTTVCLYLLGNAF